MKPPLHLVLFLFVVVFVVTAPSAVARAQQTAEEPYGAEDRYDTGVHVPEPMVFDLVRPLGAKQGELETNVLVLGPVGYDDDVEWAPEIEIALVDRFAVEFELPFEGAELEALKFAAQYSFDGPPEQRYLHGVQAIGEYFLDAEVWELSLLYVSAYRFDRTWSALALVGARFPLEVDLDSEFLLNVTPFADVGPYTTLGVEFNLASDLIDHTEWLLMPQVHQEWGGHFMIQAGLGLERLPGTTGLAGSARAIYTF